MTTPTATKPIAKLPKAPKARKGQGKPGRPPTQKYKLCELHKCADAHDVEGLYWATARVIVEHLEHLRPGTKDFSGGLVTLISLQKAKITRADASTVDDVERVAKAVERWAVAASQTQSSDPDALVT